MSSIVLLQSMQGNIDIIGDPARADGWYGYPDSLYTVAIATNNFLGQVYVEASLALNPGVNDWFPITLNGIIPYIQYPIIAQAPNGLNGGDTSTLGFSYRGNFLYLRTRVVRSNIYGDSLTPPEIFLLGDVRVVLSQSQSTYSMSTTLPPIVGFTQMMNVGVGYEVFAGVNELQVPVFRSLAAGTGINISQTLDTLTINALGSGSGNLISTQGSFLELTDIPNSYVNSAYAAVTVNSSGTGLLFTQLAPVANSGLLADIQGVLSPLKGGTGLAAITTNTLLYGSAANTIGLIAAPVTADTVLTWTGTAFSWLPASSATPGSEIIITDGTQTFTTTTLQLGSGLVLTNTSGTAVVTASEDSNPVDLVIITTGVSYNCSGAEQYIIVRKTDGFAAVAITLPLDPVINTVLTIKDGQGYAAIYPISINGNGFNIDNLSDSPFTIATAFGFVVLLFDGAQWNTIGNGISAS